MRKQQVVRPPFDWFPIVATLFFGFCFFWLCSEFNAYAREDFSQVPFNTYLSSQSSAVSTEVRVSTVHCFLHTVSVTSASTGGGNLEIFDASSSTSLPGSRRIASIDTRTLQNYFFDIYCASGLSVNNTAGSGTGVAANVDLTYRER